MQTRLTYFLQPRVIKYSSDDTPCHLHFHRLNGKMVNPGIRAQKLTFPADVVAAQLVAYLSDTALNQMAMCPLPPEYQRNNSIVLHAGSGMEKLPIIGYSLRQEISKTVCPSLD